MVAHSQKDGREIIFKNGEWFYRDTGLRVYARRLIPKHPGVHVKLSGLDGNAFAVLGRVSRALRQAGHPEAATAFMDEATMGDYDALLRTAMKYVDVT